MTTSEPRTLRGATILMSGGSRGIGLAIALRAARDGANIALLAKTAEPSAALSGTIHTAVEAIEQAGGRGLAIVGDVRSDSSIDEAVARTVERFGGIDIVVNNASALAPWSTADLQPKQYDLMQDINTRGTFMLTRAALPHLERSSRASVLTLSPPLNLASSYWLSRFPGYLISKYGMSLTTLAFAAEFADLDIRVNSLWPRTVIATDAVGNLLGGGETLQKARVPGIMADAAYCVLTSSDPSLTGRLLIDDDVLTDAGVTDFDQYAVAGPGAELEPDFFLEDPAESVAS
ncbi:SDR family oxidoreductase [Microbacterium sp. Root61]|uniref:SDR family oxidoreductase n=1 Tax=Microbacterium sp. Root61 TaxID=1736570 RepID=UPI000AE0CD96|nr:NAD(P)-dependent oxidoreductase [Microbacterium sp. Root61]